MKKEKAGRPNTLWPKEKIMQLKKLYPKTDLNSISVQMGITESAIRNAVIRFNLKKSNRYWTEDEIAFLFSDISKNLTHKEIAQRIGKSKWAVINKIREIKKLN